MPWSLVVGCQPVAERSGAPASVQLTDWPTAMLWARSGWSASIPLSSTPTTTWRLPSVTRWARSALIIRMSHCSLSRGSATTANVFSAPTSPATLSASVPRVWVPETPGVPSETATLRVAPTDSSDLPAK